MDLYSLLGFVIATGIAAFTIKDINRNAAIQLSMAGGAVVMLSLVAQISGIFSEMQRLTDSAGIDSGIVLIMMKAVGIAYLAQTAAELCRDMGENSLAVNAEIAGRIMLLTIALPLIVRIMGELVDLIELVLS